VSQKVLLPHVINLGLVKQFVKEEVFQEIRSVFHKLIGCQIESGEYLLIPKQAQF